MSRRLGRGISFGNSLDAAWGGPESQLQERYFDDVRNAGFSTVRLPVRWSAHAGQSPPYVISPAFFGRVDWAVSQAMRRDLNVVLNVHHYHELNDAPHGHRARFLALWAQIAAHYASWPRRLYFELLNEPRGAMTPQAWNELLPAALAAVRGRDPDRIVIVGPARMNDISALPQLALPADDRLTDMNSRKEWTRRVRLEAEFLGLSWCYWDFGTDFGAFNPHRGAWREPLRDALFATPGGRRTR